LGTKPQTPSGRYYINTNYHPVLKRTTLLQQQKHNPIGEVPVHQRPHQDMAQMRSAGLLAATLLLLLAAAAAVSGPPSPYKLPACQNDIDALWHNCKQYVQKQGPKQKPSSACCRTVQDADAHESCVCDYLGSRDAKEKLSMEKVFYVTKQCGVTVPAGCGE